jgi:hypothetical protein
MADKKISALDAIVSVDDADVLPIVDTSVTTTKKINVSQIKALAPVQSVASKTGAVTLVKGDVGLGNVDNTADADKPVSTATQTALNAKQDTLVSGTNIKTVNSNSLLGSGNIEISSSVAWGGITGTLSTQTDLQSALDAKEATISAGTTGQYYRGDKSFQTLDKAAVGLSNVDNTSDANKPISTATQTALDGKQATITGAATTIDTEDLTASRALVSDGSGKVAVSDVTSTELGYLDGRRNTSAVQTQVDAKTASKFNYPKSYLINDSSIILRNSDTSVQRFYSGDNFGSVVLFSGAGLKLFNRTSASTCFSFDGINELSSSAISKVLASSNIGLLQRASLLFGNMTISINGEGSNLRAEQSNLNTALNTYLTAI